MLGKIKLIITLSILTQNFILAQKDTLTEPISAEKLKIEDIAILLSNIYKPCPLLRCCDNNTIIFWRCDSEGVIKDIFYDVRLSGSSQARVLGCCCIVYAQVRAALRRGDVWKP